MIHETSYLAIAVFAAIVALTLGISFYLGAQAKSAKGYFAAGGGIHWFVNGVAFAGDYLSAASFLGICGMISQHGYDGFLYSIGFLAGWIVALLVVAEPLKRMGKYTLADALDQKFQSPAIKLTVALSTLIASLFYLIPQMVGAGALIKPLLGFKHSQGVVLVGVVVTLIVATAGMVSTTYVQFLKGALLVVFSAVLTIFVLARGLNVTEDSLATEPQTFETVAEKNFVNGKPQSRASKGSPKVDLRPVGQVAKLAGGKSSTGPLGPIGYLRAVYASELILWTPKKEKTEAGEKTTFTPRIVSGKEVLSPGNAPMFKGLRTQKTTDRLNFLSLMLALFAGTASLPHILIRYYTVKDQASARKSTIVGIGTIGAFYVLTLFIGLGAMTGGASDLTDSNMAAPLLARSFGEWLFAVISAIAFTTVLGTVSGLIIAAAGAVVHDLATSVLKIEMNDHGKVRLAKIASCVVGAIAIVLGILFQKMNTSFLVGWAFSIAASANLPALVMLLFWRGTTKQGIVAAVALGLASSLAWVLLSVESFQHVYGFTADQAAAMSPVPFSQPGIVTIPVGFLVLIVVSLATRTESAAPAKA